MKGLPYKEDSMAINFKKVLNKQQYYAATRKNGAFLVIAGAGSGKTRTLVHRVAYLTEEDVDPERILLITFTRKAANEMSQRALKLMKGKGQIMASTFHGFALMQLSKYAAHIGYNRRNLSILDSDDAKDMLNMIRDEKNYPQVFPKKGSLAYIISKSINTDTPIDDLMRVEMPELQKYASDVKHIAKKYSLYKQKRNLMDFDDLLVKFEELLDKDKIRKVLSNKYKYIMVDEYQDTNAVQSRIVQLLCSEHGNVMAVGDDFQSIYRFRGANVQNILNFAKTFPTAEVITINQNYRSNQPILALTNEITNSAKEKYDKSLFSKIPSEHKPTYAIVPDEMAQADYVCTKVAELIKKTKKPEEIAILFRASKSASLTEAGLAAKGIKFIKYGGMSFMEMAHVKDVLALLKVIAFPKDSIAWYRSLTLFKGVGKATVTTILDNVIDKGEGYKALEKFAKKKYGKDLIKLNSLINSARTHKPTKVKTIVNLVMEFYKPYFEQKYGVSAVRKSDLESFKLLSKTYKSVRQLVNFLTLDPSDKKDKDPAGKIVLSTIHSAKGLEWDNVLLIDLAEGSIPSKMSKGAEEIEEERRLFYVAATRAKNHLYMVAPVGQGSLYKSGSESESRFVTEIKNFEKLVKVEIIKGKHDVDEYF